VTEVSWPWPRGAATGTGSLPGTDIAEAQRVVLGELPDLPHLPELPARGPGADTIGRSAGLLADLPVELYAARWRAAGRAGVDLRRTLDLLERDLDQMTDQMDGYAGPFKVQSAGPWTLAAEIDLPIGGRMLRDPGAVRDLTASLAEGLARHVSEVRNRVPGASVILQLDEPWLPAVRAGRVPTESGFSVLAPVESATAAESLRAVVEAAGVPVVVHCCAPGVPIDLIQSAGAAAVGLDLALVTELDALGEALDAGLGLLAGVVPVHHPATPPRPAAVPETGRPPSSAEVADRVRELWGRLGFPLSTVASQVVVTPACGLAGAAPEYARAALRTCREAGQRLSEEDG
jgi:methionine synthase II (cobalamin-independent)